MMAHTPYGYIIRGGKAVLDEAKALQVKTVFAEYVAGESLQTAGMKACIKKPHTSIGRIIDASCYKGDDFYPAIVSRDLWDKAQKERKRRADGLGRNKNYFADNKTDISPFWGKIFCAECGAEYRRYSEKSKQQWKCSERKRGRKVCQLSPIIFEQEFEDAFMRVLGKFNIEDISTKPTREAVDIEQKYDDPFKQAEYVYSLIQIDDFDFQTDRLLQYLENIPAKFDGEFMKQIIKRIEVSHCGDLHFILINEKMYKEGIHYGNIAADENVGHTSEN